MHKTVTISKLNYIKTNRELGNFLLVCYADRNATKVSRLQNFRHLWTAPKQVQLISCRENGAIVRVILALYKNSIVDNIFFSWSHKTSSTFKIITFISYILAIEKEKMMI